MNEWKQKINNQNNTITQIGEQAGERVVTCSFARTFSRICTIHYIVIDYTHVA